MNEIINQPEFVKNDVDLQLLNTMACPSVAQFFCTILNVEQLKLAFEWAKQNNLNTHILGEGSNLLLANKIAGLVINIKITGLVINQSNQEHCIITIGAGENWHNSVIKLSEKNLNGLENLSFIPGSVGASPVQNIGAYGVEVGDLIQSVEYFDPQTNTVTQIKNTNCDFSYRDSIFKSGELQQVVILTVTFKLSNKFDPVNTYAGLPKEVSTSKNWIEYIGKIRWSKLPNPIDVPNAGSFFKNPIVTKHEFKQIKQQHNNIVSFDLGDNVKIPAAWLIDQLGFKGQINSDGIGCYKNQALVLVNTKKQSRDKILEKAIEIQKSVKQHFNIKLEIEPQLLG